jgi:hypothetical protein
MCPFRNMVAKTTANPLLRFGHAEMPGPYKPYLRVCYLLAVGSLPAASEKDR